MNNASLREADWRYLLPSSSSAPFRLLALVGGTRLLARRLVQEGVAKRVVPDLPEDHAADVVVILAGAARHPEPAAVRRALGDGGVLYWEIDRRAPGGLFRTPARTRRALARYGLHQTGSYWVRPNFALRQLYVPLDTDGALRWYLRTAFTSRRGRERLLGWGLRKLGAIHRDLASSLINRFAVTASVGTQNGGETPILAHPEVSGAIGERSTRPLMVTNGIDDLNRVVILPFATSGTEPLAVVKLPRLVDRNGFYEREQQALSALRRTIDPELARALPLPLGAARWRGVAVGVESYLPGVSMSRVEGRPGAARRRHVENFRMAASWLTEFHAQAQVFRDPWSEQDQQDWVETPIAAYRTAYAPEAEEEALLETVVARSRALIGRELPIVWEHYAYSPQNIARDGAQIRVFDWEGITPGLPLLDLIYLSIHWYADVARLHGEEGRVRGFRALFCEATEPDSAPRLVEEAIATYLGRLDIDGGFRPIALTLFALYRVLSTLGRHTATGHRVPEARANPRRGYLRGLAAHRASLFPAVPGAQAGGVSRAFTQAPSTQRPRSHRHRDGARAAAVSQGDFS